MWHNERRADALDLYGLLSTDEPWIQRFSGVRLIRLSAFLDDFQQGIRNTCILASYEREREVDNFESEIGIHLCISRMVPTFAAITAFSSGFAARFSCLPVV